MKTTTPEFPTTNVEVEQIKNYIGEAITLHGTVYKIREMSGFAFVILKSGASFLQCIYSKEFAQFELTTLAENMSIVLTGIVAEDKRSRLGMEIRLVSFKCLSSAVEQTPVVINNKEIHSSLETLLNYRPITLRNIKESAIFKIQAAICNGFRNFLTQHQFTEIHSPKIVVNGAEGGANVFTLDYFGTPALLSQSPQFYKQAMVGVFERVYEIAPVFRAEKHDTSRHINEYTSVDVELGFIQDFHDIMQLEALMLVETLQFVQEVCAEEIALLHAEIPIVAKIPTITFNEAKEMVTKNSQYTGISDDDLDPEEEKLLGELIKRETNSDFVFVTHYKSAKRPFYTMDTPDNTELTESFDLLFRGMEITTGGQRIHDYHTQVHKMKQRKMNIENFESYLMAHKYGLPPHGGFGLGLERFTAKLLGFQNVRRATLFPRDINRLEP